MALNACPDVSFKENDTEITFGYPSRRASTMLEDYGVMFYHRNRLIRPYVKLGCQTKEQVSAFFWQPVSAFFCRLTWAIRTMCKSLPSSQDVSGLLDHGTSVCLFLELAFSLIIFCRHFLPSSENVSVPFLWT